MAAAIGVRGDYKAADVRDLARSSRDANQVRRLLTLAVIYEGGTRSDAARIGGVGLQIVRDRVLRFNAAGPAGLIEGVPPGGVPLLDDAQRRALAEIVESGPIPASHGVVRWRLIDLAQWVWDEFAISISKQTLSRELRAMGYRKLSARPRHHAQDADASRHLKKLPRQVAAIGKTLARGTRLELWWQDEARVVQKNGITRRWARRGTRPSAPKDQRTTSAYIYGAICPAEGKGAALVLPRCNTEGMALHLAEISAAVAPGAHVVLLLDQAGWHGSGALVIPANITLLPLPSKCPELNPV